MSNPRGGRKQIDQGDWSIDWEPPRKAGGKFLRRKRASCLTKPVEKLFVCVGRKRGEVAYLTGSPDQEPGTDFERRDSNTTT